LFDLVITCIGYDGEPYPTGDGMFAVGWARRGPNGTIPTNRADSHAVARQVIAWLKERDPRSGTDIIPACVDATGWHRIDKAEVAAGAASGRPRIKLIERDRLLAVAQGD
jgi:ferredoxin--NADP+ reductase